MVEIPLIWANGTRKEAMDLLQLLWSHADIQMQQDISDAVCAGPPEHLLAAIHAENREKARDRRIFDRLIVLERLEQPPLTQKLQAEAARLRRMYPTWKALEGEKAHFSAWIESVRGIDTRYDVEDLQAFSNDAMVDVIVREVEMREGMLDSFRQLIEGDLVRGIKLFELLMKQDASSDIWSHAIRGMRDCAKIPELRDQVVNLLLNLPVTLFNDPDISRSVADFLEEGAKSRPSPSSDQNFLQLYDKTLLAVENDPSNLDQPQHRDWVSLAINRSMGRIATAFFAILFGRELTVGSHLPSDLRPRLDCLLAPNRLDHRPARVIAASRLSYLNAVDPDWTQNHLIPLFDWSNESEALASWQGYGWQPRIDKKLWQVLKPHFLPMFTADRLLMLDDMSRSFAQMLMIVGIEFGIDELPRNAVREAIRAMPSSMRSDAISWIVSFLEQTEQPERGDQAQTTTPTWNDETWSTRVWPWLQLVWPSEPALRSEDTAEQFSLLAIATNRAFPNAVSALLPSIIPFNAFYAINRLSATTHPDNYPEATLRLIDASVDPAQVQFGRDTLRSVLDRLREAAADLSGNAVYRRWSDRVRALD